MEILLFQADIQMPLVWSVLVQSASTPSAQGETKADPIFIALRTNKQEPSLSLISYPKRPHIQSGIGLFILPFFHIKCNILYTAISNSQPLVLERYQLVCSISVLGITLSRGGALVIHPLHTEIPCKTPCFLYIHKYVIPQKNLIYNSFSIFCIKKGY